jgi:hypothetical protein
MAARAVFGEDKGVFPRIQPSTTHRIRGIAGVAVSTKHLNIDITKEAEKGSARRSP